MLKHLPDPVTKLELIFFFFLSTWLILSIARNKAPCLQGALMSADGRDSHPRPFHDQLPLVFTPTGVSSTGTVLCACPAVLNDKPI